MVIGIDNKESYWIIPMTGREVDKKIFEWTLRPELVQAMEELNFMNMERIDFVDSRVDVVKNVYRLYSYAAFGSEEEMRYACDRYQKGIWYVVELVGNKLLFAPSRFVGYKDNTIGKHSENHGDGRDTNKRLVKELQLYRVVKEDAFLSEQFNEFLSEFNVSNSSAKFLVPKDVEIEDLKRTCLSYYVCPTHCKGYKQQAWESFYSKDLVAIGWRNTDYSDFTIEQIEAEYQNDSSARVAFSQLKEIKYGDIVCCSHNNHGLWGIGVAISSYKYGENIHYAGKDNDGYDSSYSHYVEVAWLKYRDKAYIRTYELNIVGEQAWQPYRTITSKEIIPNFIRNYLFKSKQTMNQGEYQYFVDLLENNKNLILTGAPGTGKTYLAKQIANSLSLKNGIQLTNQEVSQDVKYTGFVQFHPSFDYTDFVEGLRAEKTDLGVTFNLHNGIFKEFCKRALQEPNNKFVFIIDEINRGEISKIFGELFFSIDPGYRGIKGKVKTQYANIQNEETKFDDSLENGYFYVPENVYIIGTMNDIDRSVESMDFAMRRRFTWIEITADSRTEMLKGHSWSDEAIDRMIAMNSVIEKIDGLGKAYYIGPAYFLKLEIYDTEVTTMWENLWHYHIEPLVKEYLRGMPNCTDNLARIESAYNNHTEVTLDENN